jgi:hypothetical protein
MALLLFRHDLGVRQYTVTVLVPGWQAAVLQAAITNAQLGGEYGYWHSIIIPNHH